MLKFLFFIQLLFFILPNLHSQTLLNYGFKFGAGPSNLKFNEITVVHDSIYNGYSPSDKIGFGSHFGVFFRAKKNNIYLQNELVYTFVIGEMEHFSKEINGPQGNSSLSKGSHYFMQINLPLILGFQGGPFGLQTGPVFSYLTYKDNYYYFKESDNKFSLAYHIGLEIDINNFFISARYKNNFTPIIKYAYINDEKFDYRLNTSEFIISIGFIMGKQQLKTQK